MASPTNLAGNAPEDMKIATAYKWDYWLGGPDAPGFGRDVRKDVRFTTLNLKEEPLTVDDKSKGKRRITETIHEATVTEEMLNGMGFMHGGCTAYLIDACSSICLTALEPSVSEILPSVSLALNVIYHAPAALGATIQLISTVTSFNTRVQTVTCSVWDVTTPTHKLVASASHIKMQSGRVLSDAAADAWRQKSQAEVQKRKEKAKL